MLVNKHYKMILASSSPRRRELLGYLGLPFEVKIKSIEETSVQLRADLYAADIAHQKSLAIIPLITDERAIVIAADTVVSLHGTLLGKPNDIQEAREHLMKLSGETHEVCTAVYVVKIEAGKIENYQFVETTQVEFLDIPADHLETYLKTRDSLDKAGGYGIQGQALSFIKKINGCYANVVGFPLARFCQLMDNEVFKKRLEQKTWRDYIG
jgi:septum formation protein